MDTERLRAARKRAEQFERDKEAAAMYFAAILLFVLGLAL